MNKIFCIGFQKTGTTSLGEAFEKLGYRVCGVYHELLPQLEKGDYTGVRAVVDTYDVCKDNPWPVMFRQLDELYPGSKFILTTRDESAWIRSVVNHFRHTPSRMIQYIYGVSFPEGNEITFLQMYNTHNREVMDYFKSRPADLIVLNLDDGNTWEKICPFLSIPVPGFPFPHANKGSYTPISKLKKYFWKRIRARWRDLIHLFIKQK